jgi:TonB family protein
MRLLAVFGFLGALWAQDAKDFLNQGVQAFRNARYPEAVEAFQRAVAADPGFVEAHLYLATAYMQQFIPGAESAENSALARSATDEFLKVLTLEPNNRVAINSIASLELNQKHWDEAERWYQRLIAGDPTSADAYYSLGFIAWSRWYPAYSQARTSLGMKPEDPGPIPNAAVRQDLRARYGSTLETGIANLEKTLELNPRYSDAMAYLNLIVRERADLRDTSEEYRQDIGLADQWMQKAVEAKSAPPGRIRAGNIQEDKLIRKVDPVYPPLAAQARIQGMVKLQVTIGKDGQVQNTMVLSGHPLLVPAALEAVKQWVYRPTLLNGASMEVVTEVEVPFTLDRAAIPR